jgi:hypothetical protein
MIEGERLKRLGMARVERHADPEWLKAADECVKLVAGLGADFTTDDVYELMEIRYPFVSTHDDRAMGPVIKNVAKQGWIEKAPVMPVKSRRRTLHASPITVWRLVDPLS